VLPAPGLVCIDFYFQFFQPGEIIRDFLHMVQDDLSGHQHTFVDPPRFRIDVTWFIAHQSLVELFEIDLVPIDVQCFSNAFGFLLADLFFLFHTADPPYSFKARRLVLQTAINLRKSCPSSRRRSGQLITPVLKLPALYETRRET
jgi:hypothetical protein